MPSAEQKGRWHCPLHAKKEISMDISIIATIGFTSAATVAILVLFVMMKNKK